MALIVEDGSGLSTAESYISVADADTYFTNHGSPATWTSATAAGKEAALRYATTYLDDLFVWYSYLVNINQALGWPRATFYDSEGRIISGVPTKIKDATCELALEHLQNPLNAFEDNIISEAYGDASATYRGVAGEKSYSKIKISLRDYGTTGRGNSATLFRA